MKQLQSDVQMLVCAEYDRAKEKFGASNNSPHESYAVIKEEREEAQDEAYEFDVFEADYWNAVKKNDTESQTKLLRAMQDRAEKAAAEWIQVAAMCYKATIKREQDGGAE